MLHHVRGKRARVPFVQIAAVLATALGVSLLVAPGLSSAQSQPVQGQPVPVQPPIATASIQPGGPMIPAPSPAASPQAGVQLPTIPDPVAVSVAASTTALLTLDVTNAICPTQPACVAAVPAMANLVANARGAGALIIMNDNGSGMMAGLNQQPSDTVTMISNADKFFTDDTLNGVLQANNISTVIIQGTSAGRADLFTAEESVLHGYTTIVSVDGAPAATPFESLSARYEMLNAEGTPNVNNTPLAAKGVTLSRSDLITFQ